MKAKASKDGGNGRKVTAFTKSMIVFNFKGSNNNKRIRNFHAVVSIVKSLLKQNELKTFVCACCCPDVMSFTQLRGKARDNG